MAGNRIDRRFARLREDGRKALVPFITAGDPSPQSTVALMHTLVRAGADLLELGVPFSDPMADGPVIQASSERAVANGVNLEQIFAWVSEFRRDDRQTPVILMGYMNPVERYGYRATAHAAQQAGVDGFLLVDCPPEEGADLHSAFREAGLHQIFLLAPTTTDARVADICRKASGFVYYVSLKGVTGSSQLRAEELNTALTRIRRHTELPLAVGFGIKDAGSAAIAAETADAVVVGSALVSALNGAEDEHQANAIAEQVLAPMRRALDNGPVALVS